jgi:uncharacterized protein YdaU (DUF1376 family)
MAEFNDLTIWTDAILGDCTGLSDAEFGAYTRLLMAAWRRPECDIPDDSQWMRRTAQTPANYWPKRWAAIEPFWQATTNTRGEPVWVQKKLLKERDRRRLFRKKQSENAKARWDQEQDRDRSKKHRSAPVDKVSPPMANSSLVTPHLQESREGGALRTISGTYDMPAHMPNGCPRIPNPESRKEDLESKTFTVTAREEVFSQSAFGKNGNGFAPGTYTITDPDQRMARFQRKLAAALGPQGWMIIAVAMNPDHRSHEVALAQCKRTARSVLKKGWPQLWPTDRTLHVEGRA